MENGLRESDMRQGDSLGAWSTSSGDRRVDWTRLEAVDMHLIASEHPLYARH